MSIISIFIVSILFVTGIKADKTFFSPLVSFTFLYLVVFILSAFGWFGIYLASNKAYMLITLGIIMFAIGTKARKRYSLKNAFFRTGKIFDASDTLNIKHYKLMLMLCLSVLSFSASMIFLFLLAGGTIGDIYILAAHATDGEDNELTKGGFQILLESYIAYPLLYLLVPVSLVEFFNSYKKRYLFIAIFLALLRVGIDARRTYLASFIMMIIICIVMHRKDILYFSKELYDKAKKFQKQSIIWILIFGWIFIFVSQQRSIVGNGQDDSSILRTLTYYYGGSVQFFGDCIETTKINYTLGISSLRGFFAPIFGVLNLFDIPSPDLLDDANTYLTSLHAHNMMISPTKEYNSFATAFFQFYCDGGILGIIILSFLVGFYAQSVFEKMVVFGSKRAETTYVFFYSNVMMLSFVNMQTVLALNFWPLILVGLLYHKQNANE